MKIRFKIQISGTVHGRVDGVNPGDVVDVDDATGARYCALHYAEPVVDKKVEKAVAPPVEERSEEPAEAEEPSKPKPGSKPRA